jgi:hypothetical protein
LATGFGESGKRSFFSVSARVQAAGNLQSTPQEQVTVDQGNVVLAPPDPQMVYVPSYTPAGGAGGRSTQN